MIKTRWVIVANRASARLFEVRHQAPHLHQLETFDNPGGRLHDGDLDADRPGRACDSAGEGRHAMGRKQGATERLADDFARTLAARLEAGRKANAYSALILVAEARFLGRLRAALAGPTAALVTASLDKDLAPLDPRDLPGHLAGVLPPNLLD